MDVSALPDSIVVAIDDDTCFYTYGWNNKMALRSNRKLIELTLATSLFFRGDFILAPVGYETNNICFHAYLASPFSDRPVEHHPSVVAAINDTRTIEGPFSFV